MTVWQKSAALTILEGRMERTYRLLEEECDPKWIAVLNDCLKKMWGVHDVINATEPVD